MKRSCRCDTDRRNILARWRRRCLASVDSGKSQILPEDELKKIKSLMLLALVVTGLSASLSGCILEDRDGGGGYHHHHWR